MESFTYIRYYESRSGNPVKMPVITQQKIQSIFGDTFLKRLESVQPSGTDDRWKSIPWMTNIMAARQRSTKEKLPILMWIMVGNPQGCT
jgi:hypothetical protein